MYGVPPAFHIAPISSWRLAGRELQPTSPWPLFAVLPAVRKRWSRRRSVRVVRCPFICTTDAVNARAS